MGGATRRRVSTGEGAAVGCRRGGGGTDRSMAPHRHVDGTHTHKTSIHNRSPTRTPPAPQDAPIKVCCVMRAVGRLFLVLPMGIISAPFARSSLGAGGVRICEGGAPSFRSAGGCHAAHAPSPSSRSREPSISPTRGQQHCVRAGRVKKRRQSLNILGKKKDRLKFGSCASTKL